MLLYVIQGLVALLSLLAAGFWTASAAVKIPNIMQNTAWDGTGAFPAALQKQARLNRYAAVSAALAALAQAALFIVELPVVSIGPLSQ